MKYSRVQFVNRVVYSKTPYRALEEAVTPDFVIEDDGENHVRLQAPPPGPAVRVPWSNIALSEILEEPKPMVFEYVAAPPSIVEAVAPTPIEAPKKGKKR